MRKPIAFAILTALAAGGACIAHADLLEFSAYPFDAQRDRPAAPAHFTLAPANRAGLRVVQFSGPVQQSWLDALRARGVVPVHYVATHGYIVWTDAAATARLAGLGRSAAWLRYDAPLESFLKLDPMLAARVAANADADVDVTVQIYAHDGDASTRRFVESLGVLATQQQAPLGPGMTTYSWAPILDFANLAIRVRVADIPAIAGRADVTFVGERLPTRPMDEKQALLLAGDPAPGPDSVSYLDFLAERGFSTNPDDYPVVDVTDSTIDEGGTGVTVLDTIDPMLHAGGNLAEPVRVAYFTNCSSRPDDEVGAADGHGSLNAGIVAGYDARSGYPFQDADGQQLGLGINPFARVGSTTIFTGTTATFDISGCENTDQGIVRANASTGAKISSNSWGSGATGSYTDRDQIYDAAVRDVDVDAAGNQPMIYVFAAANAGPGVATVGSPGTAKNVITVGASENLRPFESAFDICPNDGIDAADDPASIAGFSGRGPAPGARTKPEIVAPGTHIQAGASVFSGYQGGSVCIRNYPESPAQTVFAASSGTSHSTPAISGLASLAYWWIEHGGAAGTVEEIGGPRAPSPALMKAWMMAHPTYLTGDGAGDDLPSNSQGYGMPNMADMFDATPNVLLDQSEILDDSGDSRTYTWGIVDPTRPVRIALAYTDAPGQLGASPQVNDVDLRVEAGGITYLGNHFDGAWSTPGGSADDRNNYEAVFLPVGTASGDMTITVTATNIGGDGVPGSGDGTDQDFAIVCDNCTQQPTFTLTSDADSLQVCAGGTYSTAVHVGQVVGFDSPVALSDSGAPAGITVDFDPNPTVAPADVDVIVSSEPAVAPGSYPMTVSATSGSIERSLNIDLGVFEGLPGAPSDEMPADGAGDVATTPTFSWSAADNARGYLVQVASDPAFVHIVVEHETIDTAWTIPTGEALDSSARYYWRVIARNPCGDSADIGLADTIFHSGFESVSIAEGREFTTLTLPGDCPVDTGTSVVFDDDLESGATGWTHAAATGSSDGWSLGDAANSGSVAWQALAPASGSPNDAWLISPNIALPAVLSDTSLAFWNRQSLKSGDAGVCNDGAIVEITTNGGAAWSELNGSLTDPFDGSVSGAFGNPLQGKDAWCGDPEAYTRSVLDIADYAGSTVRFRFRIGHDRFPHRPGVNWAIDDVRVSGCSQ
jgi:hypothetical protein